MPNWCQNILRLKGVEGDLMLFCQQNCGFDSALINTKEKTLELTVKSLGSSSQPLSFDRSVPIKGEDCYNERLKLWNTKWDVGDETFVECVNNNDLKFCFDTAWAPPVAWLKTVAKKYPEIHFELEYAETGMDFAGRVTICDDQGIDKDVELTVSDVLGDGDYFS